MRTLKILFILASVWAVTSCAADSGYKNLFRTVNGSLSTHDKKAIYSSLGLKQDTRKKGFILDGCEAADFGVELRDLNKDGIPEVFITGGNTCTSAQAGSSLWLFIKSPQGAYHKNLGFPASGYEVLSEQTKGFPDLQFGGPGFCEAIWRWNGTEYEHYKNIPTEQGGCS